MSRDVRAVDEVFPSNPKDLTLKGFQYMLTSSLSCRIYHGITIAQFWDNWVQFCNLLYRYEQLNTDVQRYTLIFSAARKNPENLTGHIVWLTRLFFCDEVTGRVRQVRRCHWHSRQSCCGRDLWSQTEPFVGSATCLATVSRASSKRDACGKHFTTESASSRVYCRRVTLPEAERRTTTTSPTHYYCL